MATEQRPEAGRRAAQNAPWIRRFITVAVRGRHVILHGNVHDTVLWQNGFVPMRTALTAILQRLKFDVVGLYDQVDGLVFAGDGADRFHSLVGGGTAPPAPAEASPPAPAAGADGAETPRARRARETRERMEAAVATGASTPVQYETPQQALPAIRRALAQDQVPCAFVVDFAELLLLEPEHHERADRDLLAMVKKAMVEAAEAGDRPPARNQLVLITPELSSIPSWLYRREPFVQPVEVPRPSYRERQAFLQREATNFFRRPGLVVVPDQYDESVRTLANLTEGMAVLDLMGLRRTSVLDQVPVTEPRELVNRAVFGQREDPWTRLADSAANAEEILGRRVIGQPNAVSRVAGALTTATSGIGFVADQYSLEARPKGVFFFAGPTGTGKTELAKALSELIFEDETAMIRFDMSTFAQEHAAERLTGAPPGYVGHERGGELTNAVNSRPFSVLLFDEIDKADTKVLDKFLQILEDGRLTDGLGQTTYFSKTLIIFTSNIGAGRVRDWVRDGELPSYEEVERGFTEAVRDHFGAINRPELLGRIGNGVVAFDLLRPEHVAAIATKFLGQLSASAERAGIDVALDTASILAAVDVEMARPEARELGGRRIRPVLEQLVLNPLTAELARAGTRTGTFHVEVVPDDGRTLVRRTR